MAPLTPLQVLGRRRQVLMDRDADGFADLFAPDAVIEVPFAGPGQPARLDGQQAIRDFTRHVAASPLRFDDLETVAVYRTDDPEVVIAEIVTKATLTGTGRSLTARCIQVFRIRDGKIVLFRDYADPRSADAWPGD